MVMRSGGLGASRELIENGRTPVQASVIQNAATSAHGAAGLFPHWLALRDAVDLLGICSEVDRSVAVALERTADGMFTAAQAIEEAPCKSAADAAAKLAVAIQTLRIMVPLADLETDIGEGLAGVEDALDTLLATLGLQRTA